MNGELEKADTDTRTVLTDSHGEDGQLWKRRAAIEKTGICLA